MLMVMPKIFSSISFWLLTLVILVVCLIPDYLILTYNRYMPARIARRNEEHPRHSIIYAHEQGESQSAETRVIIMCTLRVRINYCSVTGKSYSWVTVPTVFSSDVRKRRPHAKQNSMTMTKLHFVHYGPTTEIVIYS